MLPRKVYTREFKEEAVELTYRSDKTVKEISAEYAYFTSFYINRRESIKRQKRFLKVMKRFLIKARISNIL